jgi:membrane protease YdiL (CAAX protease family)
VKAQFDMRRRSLFAFCKGFGLLILLFLAVYVPVFAVAGPLRHSPELLVPLVIVLSLGIAICLTAFFIRSGRMSVAEFGLRFCTSVYVVVALVVGLPLALAATYFTLHAHEAGPLVGLSVSPAISIIYFGIGAPIQEEVIFRGLLQSVLTRSFSLYEVSTHSAPLIVATLFGASHLVVGPVTAVAALLLGIVAGELRLWSASLLPAVIVHALFNLCGMFWPQA